MTLPRKLTKEEEALRAELVELEERIRMKIRKITYTHQKLPYDRLAKGRVLKETVLMAIGFLEKEIITISELRWIGLQNRE